MYMGLLSKVIYIVNYIYPFIHTSIVAEAMQGTNHQEQFEVQCTWTCRQEEPGFMSVVLVTDMRIASSARELSEVAADPLTGPHQHHLNSHDSPSQSHTHFIFIPAI